jgi:membrane-associated protease RseP (regulator of RpoE activity)
MVKKMGIGVLVAGLILTGYGQTDNGMRVGWLGVVIEELSPAMRAALGVDCGVLVAEVADSSPAAVAGLQIGDVIMTLDGVRVEGADYLRELVRTRPGQRVEIGYLRRLKERTVVVQLGSRVRKRREPELFPMLPRRLERTLKQMWRRFQSGGDIYQETLDSLRQQIIELQKELKELQRRLQEH